MSFHTALVSFLGGFSPVGWRNRLIPLMLSDGLLVHLAFFALPDVLASNCGSQLLGIICPELR